MTDDITYRKTSLTARTTKWSYRKGDPPNTVAIKLGVGGRLFKSF